MILYLSGPISGDPDYKEKFLGAEDYLRAWKGHTVLNPAVLPEGLPYEDYMRIDLAMLHAAEGIVMLRGWKKSPGARKEFELAIAMPKKLKIFFGVEAVPCVWEKQGKDGSGPEGWRADCIESFERRGKR